MPRLRNKIPRSGGEPRDTISRRYAETRRIGHYMQISGVCQLFLTSLRQGAFLYCSSIILRISSTQTLYSRQIEVAENLFVASRICE